MKKHVKNWKKYFIKEFGDDGMDRGIMLVTGAVKTSSWGTAVISGGAADYDISFQLSAPGLASAGVDVTYANQTVLPVIVRQGPNGQVRRQGNNLPHDQTIFLHYEKLKCRKGLIERLLAGGSKKEDHGPLEDASNSPTPEFESNETLVSFNF